MNRYDLVTNGLIDNFVLDEKGKGHKFVSKFIEAGLVHYKEYGDILITKETLDKFIGTMVGCPVIINHKQVTDENVENERVGVISNVWFNPSDGWYYCDGIIWNKQAIDLVKNQGWNVSCAYSFESDRKPLKYHGKTISMEFTNGNFQHLAIVETPRYEDANIVINSVEFDESKHPRDEQGKFTRFDTKVYVNGKFIDFDWLEEKLYALNKLAKNLRPEGELQENYDGWTVSYKNDKNAKERKHLYNLKNKLIDKYGTFTGNIHKFPKGYGIEYSINGKGSFHKFVEDFITVKKYTLEQAIKKLSNREKENFKFSFDYNGDLVIDKKNGVKYLNSDDIKEIFRKNNIEFDFEKYSNKLNIDYINNDIENIEKLDVENLLEVKKELSKEYIEKANYYEKKIKKQKEKLSKIPKTRKKTIEKEKQELYLLEKRFDYYNNQDANKTINKLLEIKNQAIKTSEQLKEINSMYKKLKKNGYISQNNELKELPQISKENKRNINLTSDDIKQLEYLSEDVYNWLGTAGISSDDKNAIAKLADKYNKTSNSAERRRIIDRVISIHSKTNSNKPKTEETELGFKIERNNDINRLQLKFDGKPNANTRSILKSNGFRWSPREGAWQRQLNANSERSLKKVNEELKNIVHNSEKRKENLVMTALNDLENFVKNIVSNACEKDKEKEVMNEDKRKLIDEVGGILKGKVDDEIIRTIIGKLEKVAYEPSEDDKAVNKCKNEDEEDKKEFIKEKEIATGKKDTVENSMDKVRKAIYSSSQVDSSSVYMTREERIEQGNEY